MFENVTAQIFNEIKCALFPVRVPLTLFLHKINIEYHTFVILLKTQNIYI